MQDGQLAKVARHGVACQKRPSLPFVCFRLRQAVLQHIHQSQETSSGLLIGTGNLP